MDVRNQGSRLRGFASDGLPVPTTLEEQEKAKVITKRLIALTGDSIVDDLDSAVVSIADQNLVEGQIDQLQYLSIIEAANRSLQGDRYKPSRVPISYISQYGSIYDREG